MGYHSDKVDAKLPFVARGTGELKNLSVIIDKYFVFSYGSAWRCDLPGTFRTSRNLREWPPEKKGEP